MNAPRATQRRRRPTINMRIAATVLPLLLASCVQPPPAADAFAAWFVDRRVSCLTDLAAGEIVMNNGVLPHTSSREPTIRLEVAPLGKEDDGAPKSEYVVKFVVPEDVKGRLSDVQYVLELGSGSKDDDPPAKFTSAPPGGGIGCEGKRSHGSGARENSAAILTINEDAAKGSRVEITGGWAKGHESVTLTEKVVVVVGGGVVSGGGDAEDADDALQDDQAEAELEEQFIEEEREDLEKEIESAEEDAVEALEEKRRETEGLGSEINEAEEELVAALESNKENANQVLDSLRDEIVAKQAQKHAEMVKRQKEQYAKHEHTMQERLEAQRKFRERHDKDKIPKDKLAEMHRRFQKQQKDIQKDKLEELMDVRAEIKESVQKIKKVDEREHERARRAHVKPIPREELKLDMEELKRTAKQKMKKLSDSARVGVNELMNDPNVRKVRGRLRKGLVRGDVYRGDRGRPLPPEGRHFLIVMFALFGLVGVVRYQLDKRRRARKGRRNL